MESVTSEAPAKGNPLMARTIRSSVPGDELGVTLLHEHILRAPNRRPPKEASQRRLVDALVSLENLAELRRGGWRYNRDCQKLDNMALMAQELLEFRRFGGGTVVSLTVADDGRDVRGLRRISRDTGVNVVVTTGWYTRKSHNLRIANMSASELTQTMITELTQGIGETGVQAGIIKCACSKSTPGQFRPDEKKVLDAACLAQVQTGAPMTLHPSTAELYFLTAELPKASSGLEIVQPYVDLLRERGVDLDKFFLSHASVPCDLEFALALLDQGLHLNFDMLERDSIYADHLYIGARNPYDSEVIASIVALCKRGYESQITLSHDICLKICLKRYGGSGFAHVNRFIVPVLRRLGVSEAQVQAMLVENPRRLLCW